MIGLCRGLRYQAHVERWPSLKNHFDFNSPMWAVSRESLGKYGGPEVSHRYYQLLDACRLRMRP